MDSKIDDLNDAMKEKIDSLLDHDYKRNQLFYLVVYISIVISCGLYFGLLLSFWLVPQNWHIQIILAIMPTAIVISLLNNLNSKSTEQKQEGLSSSIPTAAVISAIKDHIK